VRHPRADFNLREHSNCLPCYPVVHIFDELDWRWLWAFKLAVAHYTRKPVQLSGRGCVS